MMILTRRGWLKHDEVQVGDQTVGYNETTGRSEWTPVTAVVHPGAHQVVRYGNSRVEFTTTPNQRWLMSEDTNPSEAKGFTRIQDRGKRDVLILAKEHHADDGLPITLEEAALLGWIAGDGWEEKARVSKATGRNAYCPHCGRGQKNRFRPATYFVSQTKKENWDAIEAAIDGHGTVTRTREYSWHGQARDHREWRLSATYARDLTERAGNPKTDCLNMVLGMSSDQRKAWLNAVFLAEGHEGHGSRSISQNDGPVMEAVKVAIYLEGYRPSINRRKEADRQHELRVAFVKPTLMVRNPGFFYEDAGEQEVWCVTTELGSFTAEQNGHIYLTGNSLPASKMASAGADWRTNPATQIKWGLGYIKNTPGYGSPAVT
jgi:hypothetical protein